jgi:hypothetical protein
MDESENKSGQAFGFREIFVLVCLIAFFAFISIPNFIYKPNTSPANVCINNLRQIDGAINEWALEKGKTNGTVVTENDITNYIKLNQFGKIPSCPSGGKYTYGKVGDKPQITCSLSTANPPHVLP